MTYTDGFDTDGMADELAWAVALFLTLMAAFEVLQSLTASSEPARDPTEQSVTFNEDVLRRLEEGKTVTVSRWHGRDLELHGKQVIDVTEVEESEG